MGRAVAHASTHTDAEKCVHFKRYVKDLGKTHISTRIVIVSCEQVPLLLCNWYRSAICPWVKLTGK